MTEKPALLFACTLNALRSPIAEVLARSRYGEKYKVYSCGVSPSGADEALVRILQKKQSDYTHTPHFFKNFEGMDFEQIIALSDEARVPAEALAKSINAKFLYWPIDLPAGLMYHTGDMKEIQSGYHLLIEKIEKRLIKYFG